MRTCSLSNCLSSCLPKMRTRGHSKAAVLARSHWTGLFIYTEPSNNFGNDVCQGLSMREEAVNLRTGAYRTEKKILLTLYTFVTVRTVKDRIGWSFEETLCTNEYCLGVEPSMLIKYVPNGSGVIISASLPSELQRGGHVGSWSAHWAKLYCWSCQWLYTCLVSSFCFSI